MTNPLVPTKKRKTISTILISGALLALAIIVKQTLISTRPVPEAKPSLEEVARVSTMTISSGNYQPVVDLLGRVESPKDVILSSAVTAFIEDVLVRDGQLVEAGSVLLRLESLEAELLLAQREADVQEVKARIASEKERFKTDKIALSVEKDILATNDNAVKRFDNLIKRDLGAQSSRDDALRQAKQAALSVKNRELSIKDHNNRLSQLLAQLKRTEALRDNAQLDVTRTIIKAPFNARITNVNAGIGERVRVGDQLLSLFSTDDLEVRAQIPSRYLRAIREDMVNNNSNTLALNAQSELDGLKIPLQLQRLDGNIGIGRGGVDGLFSVLDQPQFLELGRSLSLQLFLPAISNVIPVPISAIFGQERIYLIEENRLKRVDIIEIGQWQDQTGKRFRLVKPINTVIENNSQVLATQLPNAISGLKVEIVGG